MSCVGVAVLCTVGLAHTFVRSLAPTVLRDDMALSTWLLGKVLGGQQTYRILRLIAGIARSTAAIVNSMSRSV